MNDPKHYYLLDYYRGMFGSLKHNINLMLSQIEGNIEHADEDSCKQLKEDLIFIESRIKEIKNALLEKGGKKK